ncbi:unnamed protein product [Amoebophrya sp. A120]|nr:unnamed protein product [Amoebophrya sp. A120]|eukprot:GSA120T00003403001.1
MAKSSHGTSLESGGVAVLHAAMTTDFRYYSGTDAQMKSIGIINSGKYEKKSTSVDKNLIQHLRSVVNTVVEEKNKNLLGLELQNCGKKVEAGGTSIYVYHKKVRVDPITGAVLELVTCDGDAEAGIPALITAGQAMKLSETSFLLMTEKELAPGAGWNMDDDTEEESVWMVSSQDLSRASRGQGFGGGAGTQRGQRRGMGFVVYHFDTK